MTALLASCLRSRRAAGGAEFALILPVLIALLFGVIDVGRFMWQLNQAEKATQVGARMAIVTTPVSPGLVAHNFASGSIPAGSTIPASALTGLVCTSATCACEGTCPITDLAVDATSFNAIVLRMQTIDGAIVAANVAVTYRGSGFGLAGENTPGSGTPSTMEMSPLVTVTLTGMQFQPIVTLALLNFNLPTFSTTLTAEDSAGTVSN